MNYIFFLPSGSQIFLIPLSSLHEGSLEKLPDRWSEPDSRPIVLSLFSLVLLPATSEDAGFPLHLKDIPAARFFYRTKTNEEQSDIYSEIMQHMKNSRKQLITPAWHRRRADKLSAAARRPSKIGGGAAGVV